jgi:hypothetical protein
MKELLEKLKGDRSIYELAKAYAAAKGESHPRPDHYASTIKRILAEPDKARWDSLKPLLQVLGLDAEAALEVAASQVKSHREK